jgi:hypothetical protein
MYYNFVPCYKIVVHKEVLARVIIKLATGDSETEISAVRMYD